MSLGIENPRLEFALSPWSLEIQQVWHPLQYLRQRSGEAVLLCWHPIVSRLHPLGGKTGDGSGRLCCLPFSSHVSAFTGEAGGGKQGSGTVLQEVTASLLGTGWRLPCWRDDAGKWCILSSVFSRIAEKMAQLWSRTLALDLFVSICLHLALFWVLQLDASGWGSFTPLF